MVCGQGSELINKHCRSWRGEGMKVVTAAGDGDHKSTAIRIWGDGKAVGDVRLLTLGLKERSRRCRGARSLPEFSMASAAKAYEVKLEVVDLLLSGTMQRAVRWRAAPRLGQ